MKCFLFAFGCSGCVCATAIQLWFHGVGLADLQQFPREQIILALVSGLIATCVSVVLGLIASVKMGEYLSLTWILTATICLWTSLALQLRGPQWWFAGFAASATLVVVAGFTAVRERSQRRDRNRLTFS